MEKFLQLTTSGIAVGGIYAIAALGFVLIYKATRVINFAQGALMMLGGYLGFAFAASWALPIPLAFLLSALVVGAVAGGMYVTSLGPVARRGQSTEFAQVIITMAWSIVFIAIVQYFAGPLAKHFPRIFPSGTVNAHGVRIPYADFGTIAITLAVVLIFTLIFGKTRFGLIMRGMSDNPQAAVMLGANQRWVSVAAWSLAGAAAAIAGITFTSYVPLSLSFGDIALVAFPAVVLGGIDSIPGGLIGGILIALVQQYSVGYINPSFGQPAGFIVMLIVLLLRPNGLLGSREVVRL